MRQTRLGLAIVVVLIASLALIGRPGAASAEVIRSFDAEVRLEADTWLDVVETIVYDFEYAERHGIYRDIPVEYTRHQMPYSVKLKVVSVRDETGAELPYREYSRGSDIRVRIGDPDTLVSGQHTYRIHYRVVRAVNFFDGEPEVYWNATGNGWEVPIERAQARFYPGDLGEPAQLKHLSFYGPMGAQDAAREQIASDYISFEAENLSVGHGLTFAVRLPPDSLAEPSWIQQLWWWLRDWWLSVLIPLMVAAAAFGKWWRTGRDVGGKKAVAVEWYPPEGLSPAEVGVLIDQKCDMVDVISILFDLAARGYLAILEHQGKRKLLGFKENKFYFVRIFEESDDDVLTGYEKTFLNGIFSKSTAFPDGTVLDLMARAQEQHGAQAVGPRNPNYDRYEYMELSDLQDKFYKHIEPIRSALYKTMVAKDLFVRNPQTDRARYHKLAGGLLVVAVVMVVVWGKTDVPFRAYLLTGGVGLGIGGLILGLFARAMPARSANGSRKLRETRGFQRFVKMVEKPRLDEMHKDDPRVFGRLLPYAIALGVADQWAKGFEGLISQPPSWYYSESTTAFSTMHMVNSVNRSVQSMSSTLASSPSSGGAGGSGFSGGGSGGGFGGGGGGSW